MSKHKASIAIFQQSIDEEKHVSCPYTSDEVFEAAKRVIENKSSEILKTPRGIFLIEYSPSGPFTTNISDEWLPVYIAKVLKWNSGGIKTSEIAQYNQSQN